MLFLAVQYRAFQRLLGARLQAGTVEERRTALTRWFKFAVAWQGLVLLAIAAYSVPMAHHHPPGIAWLAPVIGAVLGTALPLQLVVVQILRAAAR